jgi:hypothetical protein
MKPHSFTCSISFAGSTGDDEDDGNERFITSSLEDNVNDDELGEDLDRLLNSSSSMSPLNGMFEHSRRLGVE